MVLLPARRCARRKRPASARVLSGQPARSVEQAWTTAHTPILQTRFCPRRERLAHRLRFTCDHTQVGDACCGIGLVASLLPITDRSNRNMERGRDLLL